MGYGEGKGIREGEREKGEVLLLFTEHIGYAFTWPLKNVKKRIKLKIQTTGLVPYLFHPRCKIQ